MTKSSWELAADECSPIIGRHLKCAKGHWSLDDDDLPDGFRMAIIMPSATVGQVLWRDQKIVDKDIGRIDDGFEMSRHVPEGWCAYTELLCVRADEGGLGELCTFTSSSWGGRKALQGLIKPYNLKRHTQFPICTASTKPRNDVNGNIDPQFVIVGWSARQNFGDLIAIEDEEQPVAVEHRPPASPKCAADIIDDSIPF